MRLLSWALLAVFCLTGCSTAKWLRSEPTWRHHHVGIAVFDPQQQRMLVEYQADKAFIPASNVKLLSFWAGLTTFGDSLPVLRYVRRNDTLHLLGTGHPLLLHPDLPDGAALRFLARQPEPLAFQLRRKHHTRFGSGWAWDDYAEAYSPEISPLPVHGNVVRFGGTSVWPRRFQGMTLRTNRTGPVSRDELDNLFTAAPVVADTQDVPFRWSTRLATELLEDTLRRPVWGGYAIPPGPYQTLYGDVPADSLYKKMLFESDNLLADHLLLMTAPRPDSLNHAEAIAQHLATSLADLPDRPRWVDGSGLSRYNLITPRSLVALLLKIDKRVPRARLQQLLPSALSFVWAKSGSMSGVYNLSGYLRTRRGRWLAFSIMHNGFTRPVSAVRTETLRWLNRLYANY